MDQEATTNQSICNVKIVIPIDEINAYYQKIFAGCCPQQPDLTADELMKIPNMLLNIVNGKQVLVMSLADFPLRGKATGTVGGVSAAFGVFNDYIFGGESFEQAFTSSGLGGLLSSEFGVIIKPAIEALLSPYTSHPASKAAIIATIVSITAGYLVNGVADQIYGEEDSLGILGGEVLINIFGPEPGLWLDGKDGEQVFFAAWEFLGFASASEFFGYDEVGKFWGNWLADLMNYPPNAPHPADCPCGCHDTSPEAPIVKPPPETTPSPIILDLDGDGVETLSLEDGVYFDHDGNRYAEKSGWVGPDDALLVWDGNGNGLIDGGNELFGDNSILANGQKAANGFEALAEFDTNNDGVVNIDDERWSELRLWQDKNGNGIVDDGEMLTLEEAGVTGLNVDYTNQNITDENGNEHRQSGSFIREDGTTAQMTDVWFASDASDTKFMDESASNAR